MAQTSYSINIPFASYPGQPADSGFKDDLSVGSGQNTIPYGALVVTDTTNSSGFHSIVGKLPASAAEITNVGSALGIAVADQARAQDLSNPNAPQYPAQSAVACRRQGRIWVKAESAVSSGSPVFVRFNTSANGSVLGSLRADADGGTAAQLPNAVFRSTTSAAGFAVVELNLA